MSELDTSLCRQRVRIPTKIISETYEEKQKVRSSIHELERWFWRKASMSETDYNYILAKRTRGKFYLPSTGFPLQEHLRAKNFNTNTNRGSAAKSYQENWAWKSSWVKWLCIRWPFQSILFLLEGRIHKNSYLKIIPQWNWRSELDASLCTEWVWKSSRIIREVMTKNKRYILRNMNWKGWSEVQRV